MCPLPDDERRALLVLVRRSIAYTIEHHRLLEVPETRTTSLPLESRGGAFVTLRIGGRLRGCIGQVESLESLPQVVARCAAGAATEDPRFDPIRPADLSKVTIEISIISPVQKISLERIVLGKHGLVVTRGRKRGVLLPQVPIDLKWTTRQFLEETCVKGGLERKAWLDAETHVEAFTAESFSEADFAPERQLGADQGRPAHSSST